MNGVLKQEYCVYFKNLVVHTRRHAIMKFKIMKIAGKLPVITVFLFTDFSY
jgi:hypothetical protein